MMETLKYVKLTKIQAFYHQHGKRVSRKAIESLGAILERSMGTSVANAGGKKTITEKDV